MKRKRSFEFITIEEAASLAKVTSRTIYNWIYLNRKMLGQVESLSLQVNGWVPTKDRLRAFNFRIIKIDVRRFIKKNSFINALKKAGRIK